MSESVIVLRHPLEQQLFLTPNEQRGVEFLRIIPEQQIHILFGQHNDARDLGERQDFENRVRQADVYVLEGFGNDPNDSKLLTGAAHNEISLQGYMDSFNGRIGEAIQGSGTYVLSPDAEAGHPLIDELKAIGSAYDHPKDFDAALKQGAEFARKHAELHNEREWLVIGRLGQHLEELAITNPALRAKMENGTLNIFMTFGAMHAASMLQKFRHAGQKPSYTLLPRTLVLPPLAQFISRLECQAEVDGVTAETLTTRAVLSQHFDRLDSGLAEHVNNGWNVWDTDSLRADRLFRRLSQTAMRKIIEA